MPMSLWKDFKDFFFPRTCMGCGKKLLVHESVVCLSCLSGLPFTGLGNTPGNGMERQFWGRFPIERASSLFYYAKGGEVASMLHGMKYYGRRKVCRQMGNWLAAELSATGFFDGIDCLIPVPLHPCRLRQRGYNQSGLLAEGISEQTGIPLCTDALVRTHNNRTQTHKSGYERWQNTDGLFAATVQAASLADRHILLVDDVLTTGATLTACADALSSIPGIRISVVTLAWAR